MSHTIKSPKKLIEVALPLDDINAACAREKSIRHGHPSTLHLWWARRPLAAARAVLFAQMVNDPGHEPELGRGLPPDEATAERERLFDIIRKLVLWENTTNEEVLEEAREEIRRSWRETCALNADHPQAAELFDPERLPAFHDPFAGGGSIPLEAQRLGLEAYASDLNPVAVLINKAMIEIPPKFAGLPPVGPIPDGEKPKMIETWSGAQGLAEDVRRYGHWMREEAFKRIGHLYPKVTITAEMAREREDLKGLVGEELTVIAWLWARTVKSPNPAFAHVDVPLASTFLLSTKKGKEAYVEPVIGKKGYRFEVRVGVPKNVDAVKGGTKSSRGANFTCVMSGTPIPPDYIYSEANAGRLGIKLLATVLDGPRCRLFIEPSLQQEDVARRAKPEWKPSVPMPANPRWFSPPLYGLPTFGDLFTARQLTLLSTLSNLVEEAKARILQDAIKGGLVDDKVSVSHGRSGAPAYADAVSLYLGLTVSKLTAYHCTVGVWRASDAKSGRVFGRQAIPMVWDFPECNPFAGAGGDWEGAISDCSKVLLNLPSINRGHAAQSHRKIEHSIKWAAQDQLPEGFINDPIICCDPPYYDNVGYADLSDFFYVWLRYALKPALPTMFDTLATPKKDELVAIASRHGNKSLAEEFFLAGMIKAIKCFTDESNEAFPLVIYYAFKQSESTVQGTASTGWETFLEAVIKAGLAINGTWPMRTEQSAALKSNINVLASSIVLVCRKRATNASTISRRDFIRELNAALPSALLDMTQGAEHSPVAPVDLSQAIIGPGMAIFSKYAAVLEADGTPMTVRTALQLINRFLAEDDFDVDTQFSLHWFEAHGWGDGKFGDADTLSRAKGTSVEGVHDSGVIASGRGAVRLLRYAEYPSNWSPASDKRVSVWEALHHLVRALQIGDGEQEAGELVALMQPRMDAIRQLAYRLYTLCERKGWADDARAYNELITSWSGIERAAVEVVSVDEQTKLEL